MVRIKGTLPTIMNRAIVRGHHASHTRNALVPVLASGQGHNTIIKISTSISTARDRVTSRDEDSDMEPITTSHTPTRTTAPPARVPLPASAKTAMYRVAPNALMDCTTPTETTTPHLCQLKSSRCSRLISMA